MVAVFRTLAMALIRDAEKQQNVHEAVIDA